MASARVTQDANGKVPVACLDKGSDQQKKVERKAVETQLSADRQASEADEVEEIHSKVNNNKQHEEHTSTKANENEDFIEPQSESMQCTVVDVRKPNEMRASLREAELERKVVKLKSTQKQLVEANSEWEKHCEALMCQHDAQAKALSEELQSSKTLIEELQQAKAQSERRARELQETLRTKQDEWRAEISRIRYDHTRQLETKNGELAEREANYQRLLARRQDGHESSMETRLEELERQVQHLTRVKRPGSGTVRSEAGGPHQHATRLRPDASTSDLRTHIAVLQAQISAFKEDFDNERADRERAEKARDTAQHMLDDQVRDINDLKRLIEQKERESAAVRNQNEYVRQQYTQKCRELESERTSNAELRAELSRLKEHPYREQRPCPTCTRNVGTSRPPAATWRCSKCTFDNPHPRVTCEICGQKASHAVSGYLATDKQRLLARQVEQSDTTGCRHQFCIHDAIEDSPYVSFGY